AAGASAADSPLRAELADWARRARSAGLEKDDVGALFTAVLESTYEGAHGDGPYDEGVHDGARGGGTAKGTQGGASGTGTHKGSARGG
ncbi:GntR family transcriptional regulator, partial [Streptomyces rhizosphaericola]